MKHRTFAWLALGFVVVAGNTALLLWMEKPAASAPGRGETPRAPREILALPRPLTEPEETALADERPRVRVVSLPDAAVRVEAIRRAAASPFREAPLAVGTTRHDGTCDLVLRRHARARVIVEKEGFARAETDVEGVQVRVDLEREGVIRGRVIEEAGGAPVPGAAVRARRDPALPVEEIAAADGSFVLRGLRAGKWIVEASSEPNPPSKVHAEVAAGGEATVEIRLRKGFTLRGRVVFAGTDRSAEEGTISASDRSSAIGPGGRFELRGLPGPVRRFRVETGGQIYGAGGQRPEVDPATGEQAGEIQVPLPGNNPRGLAFEGLVRDEEGRPVEGARVVAGFQVLQRVPVLDQGRGGYGIAEGRSDRQGRYRIVAEGGGSEILALHPGYAPTLFVLPYRSRNRAFDLVLARGASVLVTVRDAAGNPAPGAEVYTYMRHPVSGSSHLDFGDVQESLRAHPVTDARGLALLPNLGPGSWYLCARRGLEGTRTVLEVEKGAGTLAADLALHRLPSIAGRVVDRSGVPAAGVVLYLPGEASMVTLVLSTGADGRFRMDGLAAAPADEAAGGMTVRLNRRIAGEKPSGDAVFVPFDRETDIVVEVP